MIDPPKKGNENTNIVGRSEAQTRPRLLRRLARYRSLGAREIQIDPWARGSRVNFSRLQTVGESQSIIRARHFSELAHRVFIIIIVVAKAAKG